MTTAVIMASAPSNPYEIDEKITQSTTGAVVELLSGMQQIIFFTLFKKDLLTMVFMQMEMQLVLAVEMLSQVLYP